MNRNLSLIVAFAIVASTTGLGATDLTLHQVTFPEQKKIELEFQRTPEAPEGEVIAEIRYEEGQAAVELKFKKMKPAILFGGDVTSFVIWAVPREGAAQNLGELWVRDTSEKTSYSTALKSFALMITAEAFSLVSKPSDLVMFWSEAANPKKAGSEAFVFSDMAPAPAKDYPSIAVVEWREDRFLDLEQALKAFELAQEEGAEEFAPDLMRESKIAISQATALFSKSSKNRDAVDYSRRSVNLSAEAIRISRRRKEALALEAEIAARRQVMEALEARAAEAESMASAAKKQAAAAETAAAAATQATAAAEQAKLAANKSRLDAEQRQLAAEAAVAASELTLADLSRQSEQLEREKTELAERLKGALSKVAETRSDARGLIVNLPDILFATNEAEIKTEAKIVIAKLAGILLVMPELNLRIEGHTDATGGDDWNQTLSERRASSVEAFLSGAGIDEDRIVSAGYGKDRPVADNSTAEGRKKNRRVEIIISEGEITES
ncbi:MAG: OmpA family protein [Thermoanaerobaculales bacterium]|nr:OmpA family protein [Thermoanaerobaculales bacterium]